MSLRISRRRAAALLAVAVAAELVLAPAASAFDGKPPVPFALFGIPSLHSIIQAIANGFFSALASALVPSWLKHGTVATIQHLVALPDPATWPHVGRLQSDTTFLGAMLLPVTLTIGAVRYWAVGLTGAAHPATAITRSVTVTGVLVVYRWGIEEAVAGTNTLTHGILELPAVGGGLQRIIGVLFGGALLTGGGGVFGAFLVIVGVVFAAGLFAAQVLMTVVLAVLIVAGPPLIAISAIPELSHLARSWGYAVLAVSLVPVGWTILFATAGALCLDATSFTGASGGLPGHVAAAFGGLITFVIAVRLPLMAAGQLRHIFQGPTGGHAGGASASRAPGVERVRSAHARLRAVGLQGIPSVGRSVGRAAGALGAPSGGLVGATGRRAASTYRRAGSSNGGPGVAAAPGKRQAGAPGRIARARRILTDAPRDAAAAVAASSRRPRASNVRGPGGGSGSSTARPEPAARREQRGAGPRNAGAVTASRTRRAPAGGGTRAPKGPRPVRTAAASPSPGAPRADRWAAPRPPDAPPAPTPIARERRDGDGGGSPASTRPGTPAANAGRRRQPIPRGASRPATSVSEPAQPVTPRPAPRPKGRRKGRT